MYQRTQLDQKCLETLAELFLNGEISSEKAQYYPSLKEDKDLLEHYYKSPENNYLVNSHH